MKKTLFPLIVIMILAACASVPPVDTSATPISATATAGAQPGTSTGKRSGSGDPLSRDPLVVVFAKNGDLHLWDSESHQSRILLRAGDITAVLPSDDGQRIAFLRRALVEQPELVEYVSLWAADAYRRKSA